MHSKQIADKAMKKRARIHTHMGVVTSKIPIKVDSISPMFLAAPHRLFVIAHMF